MASRGKSKVYGSYAVSVLQLVGGGVLVLLAAVIQLLSLVLSNTVAGIIALLFIVLAIGLIWKGWRGFVLTGRFQEIQKQVEGKDRQSLAALSQTTGKDYSHLVRELRAMADKGLFPGAWVDLRRKEFVISPKSVVSGPLPENTTILREKKVRPVLPLYGIAATWIIYATVLPLYRWYDFVAAGALSVGAYLGLSRFLPHRTVIVEELPQLPPAKTPDPIDTGNPDLDDVLNAATEYMRQLTALDAAITDVRIDEQVEELLQLTRQILDFLAKNPGKVRQSRQFLNYYLPTTVKLLRNYDELSRERHKGENIRTAMQKIEETMHSILDAYRRELDNLYSDKAMDITLDIEVMQTLMKEENLTGNVQNLKEMS